MIGIGRGATFVNTALAQNAGCIAGIATYGGKPVAAKALSAALNGEPYPVPAYLYGDAATANAANYLKLYRKQFHLLPILQAHWYHQAIC